MEMKPDRWMRMKAKKETREMMVEIQNSPYPCTTISARFPDEVG